MIKLDNLKKILEELVAIDEIVKRSKSQSN
jgi:3-deoxy-D-manno-octulosonic acid (KDO) 8-phosphate synthase